MAANKGLSAIGIQCIVIQRFISKKDTLHAIAIVKITLLRKGKKIKVNDALAHIYEQIPEKPESRTLLAATNAKSEMDEYDSRY